MLNIFIKTPPTVAHGIADHVCCEHATGGHFKLGQHLWLGRIVFRSAKCLKELLDPEDRFTSLTFASKKDYVPLQAADLLAFYARRILTHDLQNKAWHDPFERMLEKRHNLMLRYFTRDQLIHFAKTHPSVKS